MGRKKADGIIRTVDDLTDDMKARIEALYVGERRTIQKIVDETKIKYPVISAHLRARGLTRTSSDYTSQSPWHRRADQSWAVHVAKQRLEERTRNAG